MQTTNYGYQSAYVAADASPEERASFIRKTYLHLAGAILAFIVLEWVLFQVGLPKVMLNLLGQSRFSWLIVLGGFMAASWAAQKMADSDASPTIQYFGLGLYVVAQAVIFMPLLLISSASAPDVIPMAAIITLLLFGGITFTAFSTRADFSFLGGILKMGGFVALGIIVASIMFGFTLGLLFSSIMVLFAGGCILYTTSNLIHKYNTNQHVAASLSLFASIALMFWYLLRILNRR
ncbi:MAG: Bax inhibitor-1 family protein [Verrucomicrobia bacterium]|nr:Bax inhibitor-1 family protein [Verrucomicrobiota bacterium]